MTIQEEIQQRQGRCQCLFDEIESLQEELVDLRTTTKLAADEYKALLAGEDTRLEDLQRRKGELERKKKRLKLLVEDDGGEVEIVVPIIRPIRPEPRPTPAPRPVPASNQISTTAVRREVSSAAAQRLEELANRWFHRWGLESMHLKEVNRITGDPDAAPGQALVYLRERKPDLFGVPAHPKESVDDQLKRLTDWVEMLGDYRDQLAGEIAFEEQSRYKVLPIRERWKEAQESAEGQESWKAYIATTLRETRAQIEKVETEIAELEIRIAGLETRLRDQEG